MCRFAARSDSGHLYRNYYLPGQTPTRVTPQRPHPAPEDEAPGAHVEQILLDLAHPDRLRLLRRLAPKLFHFPSSKAQRFCN